MKDVVIISAVRTPIGKFQGGLKSMSAPQLGAVVVRNQQALGRIPPVRPLCVEVYCRMSPQ
jgi:acetyl-CoA C-acetyltransferase